MIAVPTLQGGRERRDNQRSPAERHAGGKSNPADGFTILNHTLMPNLHFAAMMIYALVASSHEVEDALYRPAERSKPNADRASSGVKGVQLRALTSCATAACCASAKYDQSPSARAPRARPRSSRRSSSPGMISTLVATIAFAPSVLNTRPKLRSAAPLPPDRYQNSSPSRARATARNCSSSIR